ncbi:MAG: hypothetical protein Q8S21_04200 [Candidatus Paracaedibacteraceae bacterium]|nr:hypothetical protein [Candidatus Paracaedibacteraceae bacterium]
MIYLTSTHATQPIIVPEIDMTKIIHEGRSGQKTNEGNLVTKKFLSDDPVTECSGILHELNLFFGFLLPFPDKTDKNLKKLRAKAECSDATLVKSLKTNLNYTNNDRK